MTWFDWLPAVGVGFVLLLLFATRNLIRSMIEHNVRHVVDEKIERLSSELRKNEEAFKDELRAKEAEISSLRENVLSGRAYRQNLLDKRRFDAVERAWAALVGLASYKLVSSYAAIIKFDAAAKEVPHDAKLRQFFDVLIRHLPPDKTPEDPAKHEQPFLSPLAWAYLSAYRAIVFGAYAQLKMLAIGVEDAGKIIDVARMRNLLKAALPHHAEFIDKKEVNTFYYLLDELEQNLLAELKNTLEAREIDQASIAQSAEIMKVIRNAESDSAKLVVAQVE